MPNKVKNKMENNFTNFTSEEYLLTNKGKWVCVTSCWVVIFSSLICLIILNTYLKKLHNIIKTILTILAIHNLISYIIQTIDLYVILYLEIQNLVTCSIILHFYLTPFLITSDNLCVLSIVRYYMAWKTDNKEQISKVSISNLKFVSDFI